MEKRNLNSHDVLQVLAVGGIVLASLVIPSLPVALGAAVKTWKNFNRKELGKIIKRLDKQELIDISQKDGKTQITITDKGKKKLLEYDFENINLQAKRPDGKWRLIIFDIPEDKKRNRDAFRRKLLQLNCVWVQDSVFASAYPIQKEIDFLCHYLGISDYVTLAIVDRIERGEKLIFKKTYDSSWE
ncbi:MAG: hypothetical protein V1808_03310 [Candidatus Daviesbacteria bacterium]